MGERLRRSGSPIDAQHAAVAQAPAAMGVGQILQADVAHAGQARSHQDRRAVEQQPVDKVGAQEGGRRFRAALDQQMVDPLQRCDLLGRADPFPIRWRIPPRQQQPARRTIGKAGQSHVEARRIGAQRAAAHQDRVMASALHMRMGARFGTGDPAARSIGERDPPVEREAELQRDMRTPARLAQHETRHRRRRFLRHQPHVDRDAAVAQPGRALSISARIGIAQRDDHAADAGARHQVGAARPARAEVETGFQRHIGGCPASAVHRLFQRLRLGMGTAALLSPAAPDDAAVLHDQATDIGIGGGQAASAPRQGDGRGHVAPIIGGHGRAQGLATPAASAPGAAFCAVSAFTSRSSSIRLIAFTASLRSAVLRFSSSRHSIPKASA